MSSADLVAALSGPPGAESAWGLDAGLACGAAAGWDCQQRRVRVFAAQERLAGWLTYGRLVETARWVRDWAAHSPIDSGPPDDPADADPDDVDDVDDVDEPEDRGACGDDEQGANVPSHPSDRVAGTAMVKRLERVADGYERRHYRLFGYPGTAREWAEELAVPLVASELAVAAGLAPTTARTWVNVAVAIFTEGRLPGLARLLEAGWVDWPKAKLFVWETAHLDAAVARAVDAVVLGPVGDPRSLAGIGMVDVLADPALPGTGVPVIARWTLQELKDAIRAAITELDAAEAERRARRGRRERHVRATENQDGTADVTANLPADDAAAVMASLTLAAKAAKAAGDPRTLDQLRADELVHRATRGVHPDEYRHARSADGTGTAADFTAGFGGDFDTDSGTDSDVDFTPGFRSDSDTDSGAGSDAHPDADSYAPEQGRILPEGMERCACGRAVPVAYVPSFTAVHAGAPTKSTLVSLTMPLSTFLGLADQPGRLDGYGPVPAGLARRIAADAAREQPTFTAWRCILTDDVHGTVLGVTDPIWTPRHDPPPRLARLVTAMEPVCAFPGCRQPARRCDIDHRIPYDPIDPEGERGGGRTCSCNLQALCRRHHQQKTAGALKVRAITRQEDPAAPAGTLEWTLPSGVTCRSHPHIADPGPIPTTGPAAHPAVVAAAAHLAAERAREQARQAELAAEYPNVRNLDDELDATDWAGDSWRRSRHEAAQARADAARTHAEQAARDAERRYLADHPPF